VRIPTIKIIFPLWPLIFSHNYLLNVERLILKAKWELECGVKVSSYDPSSCNIEKVICLFYWDLGREDPDCMDN
jgi:hypothetical protein